MSFAYKISAWNRKRKWKQFQDQFHPTKEMKILDIGFNATEYSDTDNFLEKHYQYPNQITALGIDDPTEFQKKYPDVTAVQYDGKVFPFKNKQFDICWSNAVLEHVGSYGAQVLFLKEIARTSAHGFITTPNKHFPIEVHTRVPLLHWLPKQWFDAFLRFIGKEWATGDYMRLVSKKELQCCLKDAGIDSYKIIHNRLFGFTLDFIVIW